ncbi:MAG: alpha/beta hydrolase [Candidatus Methanoperedens sp.]|nr:alpha/beta hydrolase [Candidatus Methanoperedens sp.]
MKRKTMKINGLNISYLDNEKGGQSLICLHGHFGTGSMFKFVESFFDGRIILPDQRGHGYSDHADSYTRLDYIEDLKAIIDELNLQYPILLGHSLGGVNVFQYASIYKNVKMIIVEDIGTEISGSNSFIADFPECFDSIWDVNNEFMKHNMVLGPYFMESLYYDGTKWMFRFNCQEMIQSQIELNGIYWKDWENIKCPIFLLHGKKSWACKTDNIKEMAKRKSNVTLKIYENVGHAIHDEERKQFCEDINEFIIKN